MTLLKLVLNFPDLFYNRIRNSVALPALRLFISLALQTCALEISTCRRREQATQAYTCREQGP